MTRPTPTRLGRAAAGGCLLALVAVAAAVPAAAAHPASPPAAQAAPATAPGGLAATQARDGGGGPLPERPSPAQQRFRKARADRLGQEIAAKAGVPGASLAPGGAGSMEALGTAKVFVLTVEFGDKADPSTGGAAGPVHNAIPKPDRAVDNSTNWTADFNHAYYQNLLFGSQAPSFADFYHQQSQGRFGVEGAVTDWVKVPYNEAYYKADCEASGCAKLIADGMSGWIAGQRAAGRTDAQIKAEIAQYDVWSRNGTGDARNKPDGILDHLMILHAGPGQEAYGHTDPRGKDYIWSHSWATQHGPVKIGDTGVSASDYTIEPENAGVGVLAHEFGHDLGLPDLYDAATGGDSNVAFWSIMSAGSWLTRSPQEIGTYPCHMGPWEKLMLGWVDYQAVRFGEAAKATLAAANSERTATPQLLVVMLPPDAKGNNRYYLVENRRRAGYDAGLANAYFFAVAGGSWAQRFPYQPGLLIWYWNRAQADDNVSAHPGAGQVLPVNARPRPIVADDGRLPRPRVQMFDAAFTRTPTQPLALDWQGVNSDNIRYTAHVRVPARPAAPTFDDRRSWFDPDIPDSSVIVPATGTAITLAGERGDAAAVAVAFAPAR